MSNRPLQAQAPRFAVVIRNGAVLSLLVGVILHLQLPEGLFLVLAVLTVLEPNLGGGAIAGRERLAGSLIGLLAVVIASGALQLASQPLQVFCGLMLVRLFGFALGLSSGYVVGGHIVAGSLLHDTTQWWHYAFWRTVMTLIGVMIGVWLSRHIYSQRAISGWETGCNRWLLDLASALQKLPESPEPAVAFEQLRQQRNQLRQDLPQLAAEQSVLDAHNNETLLHAQLILQHGSAVMSSLRDLSALLSQGQSSVSLIKALPLGDLIQCGAMHLHQVANGSASSDIIRHIQRIRSVVDEEIRARLKQPAVVLSSDQDLFFASRVLLLCDSLMQMS